MERARIRERTEGNRKRLRALGKFVEGQPPFGYVRAKGKDVHDKPRRLDIDPPKAAIVFEMFDLCLSGHSSKAIASHCQNKYPGVASFRSAWILQILKNRMYAGQIATTPVRPDKNRQMTQKPAEWLDAHEPIVSLQMWHSAQHALTGRRNHGRKGAHMTITAQFLIRGLARCSVCESVITSHPASERNKHEGYYICRKRYAPEVKWGKRERCEAAPWNRKDKLDPQIEKLIARHFKTLDGQLMKAPPPSPHAPNFRTQRAKLVTARSNLVSMVASGDWPMEVIRGKAAEIERELARMEAEERALAAEASADTVDNRQGALSWVRSVAARWQEMPIPARRACLAAMIEGIKIGPEGIAIEWSDAATMAVRHAERRLPDPANVPDEDPARPAPMLTEGEQGA